MQPGAKLDFELTSKQGATLIADHLTYREDIERRGNAEAYIKKHYRSWIDFARQEGHGNVKPILVIGVDLTKQFASMAYSDCNTRLGCDFSVGTPAGGSGPQDVWGSWNTKDRSAVHTNCGPLPVLARGNQGPRNSTSEGPAPESITPADHNQCVFIRYYTMRWKVLVMRAGAGPHQLPEGDTGNYDDDTGAMAVETFNFDDDSTQDSSLNVTHIVPPVSLNNVIVCRRSQNLSRMTTMALTLLQNSYFRLEFRCNHHCSRVTQQQRTKATSLLLHDSDIPELARVRFSGRVVGKVPHFFSGK